MNFEINRNVLLDNLNMISHGLPSKTPMPILTGVLIEATESDIYLTSSNVDISVETLIVDKSLLIHEKGKALVSGKQLLDIIRKLDCDTLYFSSIENQSLLLKAGKGEYELRLMNFLDYPMIDFVALENPLTIKSSTLRRIIKTTVFATSNVETNPIITGVNFKLQGKTLIATATDSFRLSKNEINLDNEFNEFSVTIPAKSLDELNKALDSEDIDISMYFSSNKLLFKFKNVLFQTRLLDGEYPNTSKVFASSFPQSIYFDKEALIRVVERVSILSPSANVTDKELSYSVICLSLLDNKNVELSTTNSLIGTAKEEITPTRILSDEPITISFSSKYLLDALRAIDSYEVSLNFCGELRPVIIKSDKIEGLSEVILPIRIS